LLDLPRRLVEPPLPILLELAAQPLALGIGGLAGLAEDLICVGLRLGDQRPMLLEQAARLFARAVSLLDRVPDAVPTLVDVRLHRRERVALEDPQRDTERD